MSSAVKIAIADTSEVIRTGLITIIKKIINPQPEVIEIEDIRQIKQTLATTRTDILIINPITSPICSPAQLKSEAINKTMKCVALRTVLSDNSCFHHYDETISIYDSSAQISDKITKIINAPDKSKSNNTLSDREKEIVSQIVKGLSNKEIAEELHLSVHTVVTHRRNISAKLDIHSTSGLTIYAIVNKLIDIDEINNE